MIEFVDIGAVKTPVNTVFAYEGSNVTFARKDGVVMVNATEMAKKFGKLPADWTRQKSSKEFIKALSSVRGIPITQLVEVKQGNSSAFEQGTWMHEDVAIEFARWLSPAFAIWCNDRIKELLTIGMTATQPTLEAMLDNPDLVIGLATKPKAQREENARLEAESIETLRYKEHVEELKKRIRELEEENDFYAKVLSENEIENPYERKRKK